VVPLVALLVLLVMPRALHAQPAEDPRKTARMHLGPVYFTPTVAISNLGVDTNVFNQAGDRKRDFTFTVTPQVDAWLVFARRAAVNATGSVGLVYFHTYDSERSVNPAVSVRPEIYFNRVTFFAEGSYVNARERPNFEIDARSRRHELGAVVGVDVRVLRKISLELSAWERTVRFDADAVFLGTYLSEVLNRNERALSAALRYRWSPLTTFVVRGEAESDRFVSSPERNTDSTRFVGGVELKPRALVSGSAYVGVRRFVGLSDVLPDYQGLVASVGVGYTLLGATRLGFTADRDVSYSFERLQPYYVREGYGMSVRQALGRRFDVQVGAQRYAYGYRDLAGAGAPPPGASRVDVTRNLDASIGFRPNRDTRVGVGASYWERTSNQRLFRDYRGLRAGLGVTYGF